MSVESANAADSTKVLLRRYVIELMEERKPLRLLRLLVQLGRHEQAASTARLALSLGLSPGDEKEVERLLRELSVEPEWWDEALLRFREQPSSEHWEAIFRFAPEENRYAWMRRAWRGLLARGCDPNDLVLYASHDGILPDLIEAVETGAVSPATLVERGAQGAPSLWLGLAAQAAWLRRNRVGTLAHLRAAIDHDGGAAAFASFLWLEGVGDDQLRRELKELQKRKR